MNWKFTDSSNKIAFRYLDNGGMESCVVNALAEDVPIDPADIPLTLTLTIQEQLAQLDAANTLTQRNLRDFIMLTAAAIKTGQPVDLTLIPGVAKVLEVEAQASILRAQL